MNYLVVIDTNVLISALLSKHNDAATVLCADPDDRGDTFTEPVKFRCDRMHLFTLL